MKAYEIQTNLDAVQALAESINKWAGAKGFWHTPVHPDDGEARVIDRLVRCQKLMLTVSELSECMEGLRKPQPSNIPPFTNEEEEIADAIIRLLDYAGQYRLRIGDAIGAKMAVNEGRPFKHGKNF